MHLPPHRRDPWEALCGEQVGPGQPPQAKLTWEPRPTLAAALQGPAVWVLWEGRLVCPMGAVPSSDTLPACYKASPYLSSPNSSPCSL